VAGGAAIAATIVAAYLLVRMLTSARGLATFRAPTR
jgi:hypothetical protein